MNAKNADWFVFDAVDKASHERFSIIELKAQLDYNKRSVFTVAEKRGTFVRRN